MKREAMFEKIDQKWDVIIIGGGATGLGCAVDAASRGYKTLLVEQSDFAKGTSSRSTKLIHGGLRYLQQGNLSLVVEALKERGYLCQNAPHLIHHLPFVVPNYKWWEGPFYGIGLKIYDALAGDLQLEKSYHLSKEEMIEAIPTLKTEGLKGGTVYYDGQFDDARLAICLARTAVDQGASVLNYAKVISLLKKEGECVGVEVEDLEGGQRLSLYGKVIVNATGVFVDDVLQLDDPKAKPIITPSRGVHIVLNASFLPGKKAMLIPHTADKRVLFMVPWLGRVLVGTTDTPVDKVSLEPSYAQEEIDFLLEHARHYVSKELKAESILSVFSGLRPLIRHKAASTASLSREHQIFISSSGLVTVAGGKWTTYRKMAEDVIDQASVVGGLKASPCITKTLRLHGYAEGLCPLTPLSTYGSEAGKIASCRKEAPLLEEKIHPELPFTYGELLFAIREEMACTLEDLLARRTRSLLMHAKASCESAPKVASFLAKERGKDLSWEQNQIKLFTETARHYYL